MMKLLSVGENFQSVECQRHDPYKRGYVKWVVPTALGCLDSFFSGLKSAAILQYKPTALIPSPEQSHHP